MVLASTFITADFFWTKVKCFMSDLFLSLFFSISAKKKKKSHSCPWSVSRMDESLHSLCSSCGKFKVIFFANSVLFCLLFHAPDRLQGQPGAYICLGCVGDCSCGLLPEK